MNKNNKPVSVSILGKEYAVACNDDEREPLSHAVEFLNKRLRDMREKSRGISSERLIAMAALNITHEFLEYKNEKDGYSLDINTGLRRMQDKITHVLNKGGPLEL